MEENLADQQKRPPVLQRAKRSSNRWMRRKGWSLHNRQLVFHYAQLVWEQVSAMLPITLLQVGVVQIQQLVRQRRSRATAAQVQLQQHCMHVK